MIRRAALAGCCVLVLAAVPLEAHPAPFSYLDLFLAPGGVEGAVVLHDFDVAHDVGVDRPERFAEPAFAERYREQIAGLMERRVMLLLDGRPAALDWTGFETLAERQSLRLTFRAAGSRPGRVQVNATVFPYDPVHQTFVNVYEDGDLRHQAILAGSQPAMEYYAGTWQGTAAVLGVFIPAGIEHILIGPDHVLFLVGLLLLGGGLWRLTTIVSAFTLGHSITLSLAALDVVSPPASLIEPVIALSIVFVGADNLLVQRHRVTSDSLGQGRSPSLRDIRPWVAGVFGLVHGFGFANVLRELGLPLTALGWSLFSFNVGVEIGQLAIVLTVGAALGLVWRYNQALAQRTVIVGSGLVLIAGAYWFIERVFVTGAAASP